MCAHRPERQRYVHRPRAQLGIARSDDQVLPPLTLRARLDLHGAEFLGGLGLLHRLCGYQALDLGMVDAKRFLQEVRVPNQPGELHL